LSASDDDDLAALRRAFAAIPAVAPAPETCPPAERFLAAVRGELPPAELRDLVEHVAACPACAEDWRLAVALEQPEAAPSERARSPVAILARRRFRRVAAWCASAAAALALLVGGLLWRMPEPAAVLRGAEEGPKLLSPYTLSRESCVLRWSAVRGATTYDVDVHTGKGRSVERATRLAATQYRIPPNHLANIPAGTELAWRVTANLPGGRHRSSPIGRFVLR
jgi:hypothetical protein